MSDLGHPQTNNRSTYLIIYLSVDFKLLHREGNRYPWRRPGRCPRCGGARLWGHGYVLRFFDDDSAAVWMKRWRCPDCGGVHTMRPRQYWRGFWASWEVIVAAVLRKQEGRKWLSWINRQRQQYWWKGYQMQSRFEGGRLSVVQLLRRGVIVATHSVGYREIRPLLHGPHRIFAVTPPVRGP